MAEIPTLITIPISHYCEKARWALDRAGVAYRERAHLHDGSLVVRTLRGRSQVTALLPVLDEA